MASEVTALVARLCTVFRRDVTETLVAGYRAALDDLEPADLRAAEQELLQDSQWMPTPAEIRKTAKRIASESSTQPAEPEHWRRDAYHCPTCRDTGYVSCWHHRAMQSAIWHVRGKIERDRLQLPTCDARCTCSIGMGKPSGLRRTKRADGSEIPEPVRYKSQPMIHVDPALSSSEQIENLLAWARAWQPDSNRVPEFDDF